MSDAFSIAAVTSTLRNLLIRGTDTNHPGTPVTTDPPDEAQKGPAGPQLNLFQYHTSIDAAWRNTDLPGVRNGENAFPALPLTLHYIVTAYGDQSGELLGAAFSVLHDHPLLSRAELRATLPESDLHRQVERVRITLQPMSLDELSKLWTAFQTPLRSSMAYEVSVVLIASRRPGSAALPVITRGVGDIGVAVRPNLLPPVPTLEHVTPDTVPAGGSIELTGHDLGSDTIRLQFTHRLADAVVTPPLPAPGGGAFTAVLPSGVPAGIVTVAALIPGHKDPTNRLPLMVRPTVTTRPLPLAATRTPTGKVTLTVDVTPSVLAGQDAFLLVSGAPVRAEAFAGASTNTLTFGFVADAGSYPMRLRVDGVDSKLIADTTLPSYDLSQRLVVT